MDPFNFGLPGPYPDPGTKKSAKIMKNEHKNDIQPKSQVYHIFKKDFTLMFIAHNEIINAITNFFFSNIFC